jgi:hypothetical protein
MVITRENDNFEMLIQKLNGLKNKRIFQSYHTFGSMFLFDLGEKVEKLSQGKLGFNGDNTIIVENNAWVLSQKGEVIVDGQMPVSEIRKNVTCLVDKTIENFSFDKVSKSILIVFSEDFELRINVVNENHRDVALRFTNSNWIEVGPRWIWREVTGDHVG